MSAPRVRFAVALLALPFLFSACASAPQKNTTTATPAAKAEPVFYTARQCLDRLDAQALRWSPDALLFQLESDINAETIGHGGKSTVWRGFYASDTRHAVRTFSCSGSRLPSSPAQGVTGELEVAYQSTAIPFHAFLAKTDSDQAFAVAQKHGGEALLKKDPKQPVTYLLAMERGQSVPSWFVIYGASVKDNKGIGVVNAMTGEFVRASR